MKRCITFFLVVLTLFLIACTSVQEQAPFHVVNEENGLAEARTLLINTDCEANNVISKDNCYYEKAVILEDVNYCEKVSEVVKDLCLHAVLKCQSEDFDCLFKKPWVLYNVVLPLHLDSRYITTNCNAISDTSEEGKGIKTLCYISTASFLQNESICDEIDKEVYPEIIDQCLAGIIEVKTVNSQSDFDVCSTGDNYLLETCWIHHLQAKVGCLNKDGPSSECSYDPWSEETDPYKTNDYEKQAVNSSNENVCASINSTFSRDGCYALIAIKKTDISICENLQTPALKEQCIYSVSASN